MSALLATSLYLNGGTGIQPVMPVQSIQEHNSSNKKSSADSSSFLDALPKKEQLITKLAAVLKKPAEIVVRDYLNSKRMVFCQPHPNSVWLSTLNGTKVLHNGEVISLYFNPQYKHKSWTIGFSGKKESWADPGNWAVCAQTKAAWGNETGYDTMTTNSSSSDNTGKDSDTVVLGVKHESINTIGISSKQQIGNAGDCVIC